MPTTIPQLLAEAKRRGERTFLPRRSAAEGAAVSFAGLAGEVERIAAGLRSLGVGHGDRVALLAENRAEWLIADLATACLGAVDVPRGVDTAPLEMHFILRHSGCVAAFVEKDSTARELLAGGADLPQLRHIISLAPASEVPGVIPFAELGRRGDAHLRADPDDLPRSMAAVAPGDLLTIVYTSGTTAEPKGVMLTHGNVTSNLHNVGLVFRITEDDVFLSALPAWHMYERILDYLALACGAQLVYTDRRRIKEDLTEVRPTVFGGVPRIWEMLHDGVLAQIRKATGLRGSLAQRAVALSRAVGAGTATMLQRLQHRMLDPLVLRKVRAAFGGRLRLAISGGGSLPRHVDETLLGFGIPLLNGYGLTETSPVASVRRLEQNSCGHIGPPLPATEVQIRDPQGNRMPPGRCGLIWIKGPQVMRGYYENPQKTAEVLCDGWFNSGDLGHVDHLGRIWITGRAKDTIVLAGGENVEPEPLEAALKTSPFIDQAMVLGQDQKSLGVLLVVNAEVLAAHIAREQWEPRDGCLHGRPVLELMRREIDRLLCRDSGFRTCDRIGCVRVLVEPFSIENGCLTQTMKLRRHVVCQQFGGLLRDMFVPAG